MGWLAGTDAPSEGEPPGLEVGIAPDPEAEPPEVVAGAELGCELDDRVVALVG